MNESPLKIGRGSALPFLLATLFAGCSYFAPVYQGPSAMVTIKSPDMDRVKTAILTRTAKEGFRPVPEQTRPDVLEFYRPLSMAKVFLTTESIRSRSDREIWGFDLTRVNGGTRVVAFRIEQIELPNGGLNQDPLMDRGQHDALQALLDAVRNDVESKQPNKLPEATPRQRPREVPSPAGSPER